MWVGTTSFMSSQSFGQSVTVNLQYYGIKIMWQCSDVHCLKNVCIWGCSVLHFSPFWVNTGIYSVSLHIIVQMRERVRTRKKLKLRYKDILQENYGDQKDEL